MPTCSALDSAIAASITLSVTAIELAEPVTFAVVNTLVH